MNSKANFLKKGTKEGHFEHPAHKKNPKNKYSMNILKSVVGKERAEYAYKTISMGYIPGLHMSNLTINCIEVSLLI